MRTDISAAISNKAQAIMQHVRVLWCGPQIPTGQRRPDPILDSSDVRQTRLRAFTQTRKKLRDQLPRIWG